MGDNGEIRCGHQLAAGCRGHGRDLGNDHLRSPADRLHHLERDLEQSLHIFGILGKNLMQVVPR
jgi:hypothetical protein